MSNQISSIPEHIKNRLYFDTSAQCAAVVQSARHAFVRCLELSGLPDTVQSCVYASYFLSTLISKFHPQMYCKIVGGGSAGGTGVHLGEGQYAPHFWVEVEEAGQRFTVDISCDQFGFPDIVLCPSALTAQIFCKEDQAVTDEMLGEIESEDEFFRLLAQLSASTS